MNIRLSIKTALKVPVILYRHMLAKEELFQVLIPETAL